MKEPLLQRCQREAREQIWEVIDSAKDEESVEELDTTINDTIAHTLKQAAEEVIKIPITQNNGDYELAQLRYREKVVAILTEAQRLLGEDNIK